MNHLFWFSWEFRLFDLRLQKVTMNHYFYAFRWIPAARLKSPAFARATSSRRSTKSIRVTSQTQKSKIFSRLKKRSKSKSTSNYKINKPSYFFWIAKELNLTIKTNSKHVIKSYNNMSYIIWKQDLKTLFRHCFANLKLNLPKYGSDKHCLVNHFKIAIQTERVLKRKFNSLIK